MTAIRGAYALALMCFAATAALARSAGDVGRSAAATTAAAD